MLKLAGNIALLAALYGSMLYFVPQSREAGANFILLQRIGLDGILCLAAGALIISGGIDLSMGSVIAFTATTFVMLMTSDLKLGFATAVPLVLLLGASVGLLNGVLIAVLRIQPFVVTLCGLFVYRSAARFLAGDATRGFGQRATDFEDYFNFFNGNVFGVHVHFWIFLALLILLGVFLHFTVAGRYLFAIGSNEKAANYCGISTIRYKVLAYVLCSLLATLYAILFVVRANSVQPSSTGQSMELAGIAGAVIGGCSLRGGDGNVFGIMLGTAIIVVLPVFANYFRLPNTLVDGLFGLALLVGAVADELMRRYAEKRKK